VTTFADLLRRIHDEVPAIQRLRFVTSYPRDFGDDVLEVMRDHPRICRYLHVPAQSGSNRLLQMMNRGYSVEEYLEFLDRAKQYLHQPEIGRPLTTSGDFIIGFPSETDEDFELTKDLVRRARYKNAFIFKYSPRPGTPAFDKLADDVPEAVKRRRNNELLALQTEISHQISLEQVGSTFDVMVEGLSPKSLRKRGVTQGQRRAAGQVAITISGRRLASGLEEDHVGACSASGANVLTPAFEDDGETVQLSCRTDGDLIVFVEVPRASAKGMLGRIVRVRVDGADNLSLHGAVVG
jgi:tRNA-2-methylthio-N6-dimethylallyladenosine synthase